MSFSIEFLFQNARPSIIQDDRIIAPGGIHIATQAKAPMIVTTCKRVITRAPTTTTFTDEQIAARMKIFEREGPVHGNGEQHWLQAIEELTAELQVLKSSADPALRSSPRCPRIVTLAAACRAGPMLLHLRPCIYKHLLADLHLLT
jgi:hypothetical protein